MTEVITRESHNSDARASGKVGRNCAPMSEARTAACRLAKCLGLPRSFRNLYIIELAIETEVELSSCSIDEATTEIIEQARAARSTGIFVNYHWFEDAGWQFHRFTFKERDDRRMRQMARYY